MSQENSQLEEIWKPVKNYEGLYEISSHGRIASLNYNHTGERKLMTPNKDKDGYFYVGLSNSGKVKNFRIHRLVATTFIPNPNNLPCIDHGDGIRDNNHVSNLDWCTYEENNSFPLARENKSKALKGKPKSDEARANMSKGKKDIPNSIKQIHKRAKEAGDYERSYVTFRKAYNDTNHKDHQMAIYLVKKYTVKKPPQKQNCGGC